MRFKKVILLKLIILLFCLSINASEIWHIDKVSVIGYEPTRAEILVKLVVQQLAIQGKITGIIGTSITKNSTEKRIETISKSKANIGVSSEILVMDSTMYIYLDKWNNTGKTIYNRQLKLKIGNDVKTVVSYIAESLLNKNSDRGHKIPGLVQDKNKKNIAVAGFEGIDISNNELLILADRLTSEIVKLDKFNVLERNQIEAILKEQEFVQTGCVSSECAIEVGQLLGVDEMLIGKIGKLGNVYIATVKLVDVAKGKIVKQENVEILGNLYHVVKHGIPTLAQKITNSKVENNIKEVANYLEGPQCDVTIETYPDDTKIYMNDSLIGTGDIDINIYPGMYEFRCTYEDSSVIIKKYITTSNEIDTTIKFKHYWDTEEKEDDFFLGL